MKLAACVAPDQILGVDGLEKLGALCPAKVAQVDVDRLSGEGSLFRGHLLGQLAPGHDKECIGELGRVLADAADRLVWPVPWVPGFKRVSQVDQPPAGQEAIELGDAFLEDSALARLVLERGEVQVVL